MKLANKLSILFGDMKNNSAFICIGLFALVHNAVAESYVLHTEMHCASRGAELSFDCKPGSASAPAKLTIVKAKDNNWIGKEDRNEFELFFVKEDKNILILNYPVLYSGIANVVIFKHTNSFYITEIAYSSVLKQQSYDVETGKVVKIH